MTDPNDPNSAIAEAQAHVRVGNIKDALARLESAATANPNNADLHMNLAMVHRNGGNLQAALSSLDQTLAIDPYSFLALLSKASILETLAKPRAAAEVYRNALKLAPSDEQLPPGLKAPVEQARKLIAEQSEALAEHLRNELGELMQQAGSKNIARFDECIDVVAGKKRVFHAEPIQIHYPRLPAIPFFDREYFPWFEDLEAGTDTIRSELLDLVNEGLPGFSPYVAYAPGTPENQFADLNHSQDWSSLWLWRDGVPQKEAMARCPKTTAILESTPLCDQPDFAPTALFSALAANTRIPPHTGSTNVRLLVHLPLILPGPAGFRVGNEVREWRMGEAWAFDDTIEHEAWNDADQTRVIMIFDIWNPLLSESERDLVRALLTTHRDWLANN